MIGRLNHSLAIVALLTLAIAYTYAASPSRETGVSEEKIQIHKAFGSLGSDLAKGVIDKDMDTFMPYFLEHEGLRERFRSSIFELMKDIQPDDSVEGIGWGAAFTKGSMKGVIGIDVMSQEGITRHRWKTHLTQHGDGWLIDDMGARLSSECYRLTINAEELRSFRSLLLADENIEITANSGMLLPLRVEEGYTGLIILAEGEIKINLPPDMAEKTQIKLEDGGMKDRFTRLFLRFHPDDHTRLMEGIQTEETGVTDEHLSDFRKILNAGSSMVYNYKRYSVVPQAGTLLIMASTIQLGTILYSEVDGEVTVASQHFGYDALQYRSESPAGEKIVSGAHAKLVDTHHYQIRVEVIPDERMMVGEAAIKLQSNCDNLGDVYFMLGQSYVVEDVSTVSGIKVEYQHGRDVIDPGESRLLPWGRKILRIQFADPINEGDQIELVVKYSGLLTKPKVSAIDGWYPYRPEDAATAEISVTVPLEYQGISNGTMAGIEEGDGHHTLKWLNEEELDELTLEITKSRVLPSTSVASSRDEKFQRDIEYLATQLPLLHPDPFTRITQDEFQQAAEQLIKDVPSMTDTEAIFHMVKLVAMIGDSHTEVFPDPRLFHVYPIDLYWFSDGPYVVRTTEEHKSLLGAKLLRIGSFSAQDVFAAVSTLIAHENEARLKSMMPQVIPVSEVLNSLKILPDTDKGEFVFEDAEGRHFTVEMEPIPLGNLPDLVSYLDVNDVPKPLYMQEPDQASNRYYWFRYLDDSRTLYFKYDSCKETPDYPMDEFIKDMLEFADSNEMQRFVIDLRDNGGGSSSYIQPLIREIRHRDKINRSGHLFVVLGRKTFSATTDIALDLKEETNGILIGEPTGGKPNHFGKVERLKLPNTKMTVRYSTRYIKLSDRDDDTIHPDILAEVSSADYFAGRDPVLDAILSYRKNNLGE